MRTNSALAAAVRTGIVEDDRQFTRRMLDRAIARGELPATADSRIFREFAPALLFMRITVHDKAVDDEYLNRVTDDIRIPLMAVITPSTLL